MTTSTAVRVSGETVSGLFMTRETVAIETPTSLAISLIVSRGRNGVLSPFVVSVQAIIYY
jgi:hypothetical protein